VRRVCLVLALAALTACGGGSPVTPAAGATNAPAATRPADCPKAATPAKVSGPSATLAPMGEHGGVTVAAAVYPRPDYDGNPWSQWGQGVVLPDGRFVSAMGDEGTTDADSFIFEYDPTTNKLTRTADVLSIAGHTKGDFGYGKIHAQMRLDPCGTVYAATYWGSQDKVDYSGSYSGDLLMTYDPATHTLHKVAVPFEHHGIPSLAAWFPGGLLYMEAADPDQQTQKGGSFTVWDLAKGKLVFQNADVDHEGYRNIIVDATGKAYFAGTPGKMNVFDPAKMKLTGTVDVPGGGTLRGSTPPAPDGTVYAVTQNPSEFFAMASDGSMRDLGAAQDYTTSLALDPDGSRFFYVPGAHGKGAKVGTPLVQVDTQTGKQTELVALNDLIEGKLHLTVGGSYDVAYDAASKTVYVGLNAGEVGGKSNFGEVVLAAVHVP
jgi:sugar lactone lactonase YvrE